MRPRAFADLAQLPERQLLESLSEGLRLIAEHVATLERDIDARAAPRVAAAVRVISDDEAGKYLILLDAVRCCRRSSEIRANQFKRAGLHLPKGIYADVADIRPADFAEVLRRTHHLRLSHYLDGPLDVDWILRNALDAQREERLYVDYVASDEGHYWNTPASWDDTWGWDASGAVQLIGALHSAGVDTPAGLKVVADIWESFLPEPDTHCSELFDLIHQTLDGVIEATGATLDDGAVSQISDRWSFPLWGTDLSPIKQDLDELRREQENWDPGY
jgi:hypothetical protein